MKQEIYIRFFFKEDDNTTFRMGERPFNCANIPFDTS